MASFWYRFNTARRTFRAIMQGSYYPEGGREIDITSPPRQQELSRRNVGNSFQDYDSQVLAIYRRYNNLEPYGCTQTRSVIDWRATQIAGNGVNAKSKDKTTNDFIQDFLKRNQLSGRKFWEWARDAEMEGKALLTLIPKTKNGNFTIEAKNIPWVRWGYDIKTAANDVDEYIKAVYEKDRNGGKPVELSPDQFVYVKISGATADRNSYHVNKTPPRIANVLWHIDNIDVALSDLRCNNRLFNAPKLVAETQDELSANTLRNNLFGASSAGETKASLESDVGEFYIIAGRMYYAEPSGQAVTSLTTEVNTLAKIISGATGIPIHYLGFTDLMSNRATAEDLAELVNTTTSHERESWKPAIKELLSKACEMHSKKTGVIYDTDSIEVSIPVVMMQQINQIANVYLPLYDAKIITRETVQERVPGIDPEIEQKRMQVEEKKKQKESAEMTKLMMQQMQSESDNTEKGDDDESDSDM